MKKSLVLLPILVVLGVFPAFAQVQSPSSVPRIGVLTRNSNPKSFSVRILKGLSELGYVEGKNMVIELRTVRRRQLAEAAAELVRLEPDVIVTTETGSAHAIKRATQTIPVVFMLLGDPVFNGLVKSFARPGGNITGVTGNADAFRIKLLDLLKETFPGISRVGIIRWIGRRRPKVIEHAARSLGIALQVEGVKDPDEIDNAFSAMKRDRVDGIAVWSSANFVRLRKRIVKLAEKSRLPVIYQGGKHWVEAGGLMSYGWDLQELSRRAAYLVDKVLKGAKPKDLPVERPTKGVLRINLKTAKKLGFTIPPEVLMFADEVIR